MRYVLLAAGVLALHASGPHSQGHRVDSTTIRERASFLAFVDDLRRTLVETADADEQGPDSVVTKEQHVACLRGSYDALKRAAMAIGNTRVPVVTSPISPLSPSTVSRPGLIAEALIHSYDHYGQLVVYLRMNGITPPASRR